MKQRIARFISIAGHPFLTIQLYVLIVMFAYEDLKKAILNSFLIIGCVFIPLIIWLYLRYKKGFITNFDVSDRKQRESIFVFIIPILSLVTFIVYKTDQSRNLYLSLVFAIVLLLISQAVNFLIKSSLHVSLNIYLSFLVMTVNYKLSIILLLFTILIGWSRIIIGRHTLKEVLVGATIGISLGLTMAHVEGYL